MNIFAMFLQHHYLKRYVVILPKYCRNILLLPCFVVYFCKKTNGGSYQRCDYIKLFWYHVVSALLAVSP